MIITGNTKLTRILEEYPWLIDEAVKINNNFKMLKKPVGRMMLKGATIATVSAKVGLDEAVIIAKINDLIEAHEKR